MGAKILAVDDDVNLVRALVELLSSEGYRAAGAYTAEEALEKCREETFHLVLTDLQLPGRNGISLIKTLHEMCPETKCVLITAHGSIRSAVTALKRGAVEYITKPIKPRRLLQLIAALTADSPEYLTNKLLSSAHVDAQHESGMVARSAAMATVFERIRLAGASDSTVLITGETGAGKEMAARAIHQRSKLHEGPFVIMHTAAIPADQSAGELFGLEKTGGNGAPDKKPGKLAEAEGGTLFIDEITALDDRTQVALLRVLESGQYLRVGGKKERAARVRVLAASSRDLDAAVQAGQLREDLRYRLNVFAIQIPPLRERSEDIPVVAAELLNEFAQKYGKPVTSIPAETQRLLSGYAWPGNVRELRNVIEQAVLLARGHDLDAMLLPKMLHRSPQREEIIKIPIGTAMDDVEREVILRTLEANGGNKTVTAEVLGISRRSIYNKLAVYGIGEHDDANLKPAPPR
jgi:DNA-binding NtrC family response regulator